MKAQCEKCGYIISFTTDMERDALVYEHNSKVHYPHLHRMFEAMSHRAGKPYDPMQYAPSRKKGNQ
jgi:hypothetical protein